VQEYKSAPEAVLTAVSTVVSAIFPHLHQIRMNQNPILGESKMLLCSTQDQGNLLEGVMAGKSMLKFIPIKEKALQRSPSLLDWIRAWSDRPKLEALKENQWFWEGQG
jgi:hypothetical protein